MEMVLIDAFVVPEESQSAFLERARKVQQFIRTLPGYVEGFVFEQRGGESRYNILTTAVWESEEAFENARRAVASEYRREGFNPQQMFQQLGVEKVRAVYVRTAY